MSRRKIVYDTDTDSDSEFEGTDHREEKRILRDMDKLGVRIQKHHKMHGGKINIAKSFSNLGSTIKKGFESKVSRPAERDLTRFGNQSGKFLTKAGYKTGDYITSKKGGLASDLIEYGIPAATAAFLGGASTAATAGNPVAGVAGSAAGAKLGKMLAAQVHKSTGSGIKGSQEAREKMARLRAMRR